MQLQQFIFCNNLILVSNIWLPQNIAEYCFTTYRPSRFIFILLFVTNLLTPQHQQFDSPGTENGSRFYKRRSCEVVDSFLLKWKYRPKVHNLSAPKIDTPVVSKNR